VWYWELKKDKLKARRLAASATPPVSSEGTTVWYWELDGVPTTVMYTEERGEVWCNGYILETSEGCDGEHDVFGYVEFDILLEQTGLLYEGRIRRHLVADGSHLAHQLYVNGCPIMEHAAPEAVGGAYYPSGGVAYGQGGVAYAQGGGAQVEILSAVYGQGPLPDYYASAAYDAPPRYEDAILNQHGAMTSSGYRDDDDDAILRSLRQFSFEGVKKTN